MFVLVAEWLSDASAVDRMRLTDSKIGGSCGDWEELGCPGLRVRIETPLVRWEDN